MAHSVYAPQDDRMPPQCSASAVTALAVGAGNEATLLARDLATRADCGHTNFGNVGRRTTTH